MANVGAPLGAIFQTSMPAMGDDADIQQALQMLWYGDPNADEPTQRGVEGYLSEITSDIDVLQRRGATDVIFSDGPPERDTEQYTAWIWVDTSRQNPDNASRPVYIWRDGWTQVAGAADPTASYDWQGDQHFAGAVKFDQPINQFASAAERDASSPVDGTISYLDGQYEYRINGKWVPLGSSPRVVETRQTSQMVESDAGKVLVFDGPAASYTLTKNQIRVGETIIVVRKSNEQLQFLAEAGVALFATATVVGRNSAVMLTKIGIDQWTAIGLGSGLPVGGATGQVPMKRSGADYDVDWVSVVPRAGGQFTGGIAAPSADINALNTPSGGIAIGGSRIFVQRTQPIDSRQGDVWIQV